MRLTKSVRKKLLFTALMLAIFCIGSNIPVAGVSKDALQNIFNGENAGLFDLYNLFTGGSFQNFTLFALGVTPYITASIVIQLLTIAFPYFENLAKEGETGRKKMATITRYVSVVLALLQATGMTLGLFKSAIIDDTRFTIFVIVVTLTAGVTFLMWLGEQINEYGIGNGISLLIFAGIAMRLPSDARTLFIQAREGVISWIGLAIFLIIVVAIIAAIIFVDGGIRKIPIQYATRVVGRKTYGGQSTHLPIKLNSAGVIPIIFSLSMLQFPMTIAYFVPNSNYAEFINKYLSPSGTIGVYVYVILNIIMIIGFTYFYTAIIFKPDEVSKNLMQAGGSIPAIRQGKPTEEYLRRISGRLCFGNAIFLAVIATLPTLISQFTPLDIRFGGTSILILIGVALETVTRINAEQEMYRYQGFLK